MDDEPIVEPPYWLRNIGPKQRVLVFMLQIPTMEPIGVIPLEDASVTEEVDSNTGTFRLY